MMSVRGPHLSITRSWLWLWQFWWHWRRWILSIITDSCRVFPVKSFCSWKTVGVQYFYVNAINDWNNYLKKRAMCYCLRGTSFVVLTRKLIKSDSLKQNKLNAQTAKTRLINILESVEPVCVLILINLKQLHKSCLIKHKNLVKRFLQNSIIKLFFMKKNMIVHNFYNSC